MQVMTLDTRTVRRPDGSAEPLVFPPAGIVDVYELATAARADQVWLHPTLQDELALEVPSSRRAGAARHPWAIPAPGYSLTEPGLLPWMSMHAANRPKVAIALPTSDEDSPLEQFARCADAETLQRSVWAFQEATHVPFASSPGWTSMTILHQLYGRTRWPGDSSPPDVNAERPYSWSRTTNWTPGELRDLWVHAFDLNGQYLAAAGVTELGTGVGRPLAVGSFHQGIPGYWYVVDHQEPSQVRTSGLPPVLNLPGRKGWVTTPTLALAAEAGVKFDVREAFMWTQHARWLRGWYERLRDARYTLGMRRDVRVAGPALATVKRLYTEGLGWLAADWRRGDVLHRPDWYDAIRGQARANLWRALRRLNVAPFALDVDMGWWISHQSRPLDVAESLGLKIGPKLGEWKVSGTFPAGELLTTRQPKGTIYDALGTPAAVRALRAVTRAHEQAVPA